jgi:hypothetical protein
VADPRHTEAGTIRWIDVDMHGTSSSVHRAIVADVRARLTFDTAEKACIETVPDIDLDACPEVLSTLSSWHKRDSCNL